MADLIVACKFLGVGKGDYEYSPLSHLLSSSNRKWNSVDETTMIMRNVAIDFVSNVPAGFAERRQVYPMTVGGVTMVIEFLGGWC